MTKAKDRICVGVITGAFGVRGEARLKSFCAEPADIATYGRVWNDAGTRSFTITLTRPVKGGFAARLSDVGNKDEADALRGEKLYADRAALPKPAEGEYYHSDLLGLRALDVSGTVIGKVGTVQNFGAGDILEIVGPDLKTPVMIPFSKAFVPSVDLSSGIVVIDPPRDLLTERDVE